MSEHISPSANRLRIVVDNTKWSKERVIDEARRRTKELFTDNMKKIQHMLACLLDEAGWTEDEFIDALCQDAIQRGTH